MTVSVFDLFKPGVGPSSSHTMGPMTAAARFRGQLLDAVEPGRVARLQIRLYASLALTGRGHATDRAVMLGLLGFEPASLDPDAGDAALEILRASGRLSLGPGSALSFDEQVDILWLGRQRLPQHPNALTLSALDSAGAVLLEQTWFSVGGGFVREAAELGANAAPPEDLSAPHPFVSGADLLERAAAAGLTIAQLMMTNETARAPEDQVRARLDGLFEAMEACIDRGMRIDGHLPGGLNVKRRAKQVHTAIMARIERQISDPLAAMDFVNLWALAVNEENAAGGCASMTGSWAARRRGGAPSC
jgi:L-serine dehydratase